MIPTVKWIRKGFAAEHPTHVQPPDAISDGPAMELEEEDGNEDNFDTYDQEESSANKRPADLCL